MTITTAVKTVLASGAIAATALFALAQGATAQNQPAENAAAVPAQIAGIPFPKYLDTPGYKNSLTLTVTTFERQFGACADAAFDARLGVGRPTVPTKFPGATGPVPQWLEIARIEGCEAPYSRPILVAMINDKVTFHPLLTGDGVSGVVLQNQVLSKLLEQEKAKAQELGCSETDDLRITQHDMVDKSKKTATGSWDEVWHVKNCKGPRFVQVTFHSDEKSDEKFKFQDIEMKKN